MTAYRLVVSDATPLIALAQIAQHTLLLELFGEIQIPTAVYDEVVTAGAGRSGALEIANADWITVKSVIDLSKVNYLSTQLDKGEAEALVLAQEVGADRLLVDERRARTIAQRLGLQITGTAGVLLLAKQMGKITEVRPLLDQLRSNQFRLSDKVYDAVLQQAGET